MKHFCRLFKRTQLWNNTQVELMSQQLEQWCELAKQTDMTYIRSFAKLLRKNKTGIFNYAKYQLHLRQNRSR